LDKSIFEKQKEPLMVQCLFAQSALYQKAKKVAGFHFGVTVVLMCILAIVQSFIQAEWLTGLSIGLSVAACFAPYYADSLKTNLKINAANIQQFFDVTIYSFSDFEGQNKKWFCPITKNQVIEMVSDYPTTGFRTNDIWYEDYSSKVPWEQIYFCQRENIRWDGKLRHNYRIACNIVFGLLLLTVVILAFVINPTLQQIISALPWGLPLLKFMVDFNKAMNADERRIKDMNAWADMIDNDDHISYASTWIEKEIELQNRIYEHRKNAVLIPTFFYKLYYVTQQKTEENIAKTHQRESEDNDPTNKTTN
jgi:hypothetical protein